MYVCPFDPINFDVLSNDNIGIGVKTSFGGQVRMLLDDICNINLVSWPIKRVTTMDEKSLLQNKKLQKIDDIQETHVKSTFLVKPLSKKMKVLLYKEEDKKVCKSF